MDRGTARAFFDPSIHKKPQMQQKRTTTRKPFANLLPFTVGAAAVAVALVACDRPAPQADADTARESASPAIAPMNVQPPRDPQQAAPSTPAAPLPPPEALADTVITGKIKAAILTDPAMRGADVSVNTDRGVVVLAGLVKTPEQTAIASAYAQRQDGVMRVDNHLSLPPE